MMTPPVEWFADQDYWKANRAFIWTEKRMEASGAAAGQISALLRMKPGDSVLDLACGFGRHSLALSALGCRVTGVDLNPGFISEALKNGELAGSDARFIRADMREFMERDGFDHVILMYNSFGYFRDPGDDARVIGNCFASLRPGGRFLLQVVPRELVKAGRPSGRFRHWYEEKDGTIRLEESEVDPEWTWNTTRWILLKGTDRREYVYGMRLYGSEEVRELLSSRGFSSVAAYGDLGGKPYEPGRDHLTVAAEKPRQASRNNRNR